MDRKEEIIKLQMDVINQMTQTNLRRIADDLWGLPTLQTSGAPTTQEPQADAPAPPVAEAAPAVQAQPQEATKTATEEPPEKIEDLKKELEDYIGLSVIKKEVQSLINLVTVQELRKQNDLPVEDLSLHMVFSGNPGTGKTMIARLMSRIYRSLGILSKGQLVEVDRGGLVAGYVGQTAIKTGEAIQKALGGVLFVDEAYALTDHGENDYGQEAVDTMLKAMEDHRDDLVVIVAGYTELMETFVHSNPGLESRFNRFMNFPDYTVEEMLAIFDMRCNKSGYRLADDARDLLKGLLALLSMDVKGFGNARGVRNLFERAVSAQANRLAALESVTRETLMLITSDDLRVAVGEDNADDPQKQEADTASANASQSNGEASVIPEDVSPANPAPAAEDVVPVEPALASASQITADGETPEETDPDGEGSTVDQLFRSTSPNQP